jgi:DNA ligase (NAD+)
MVDKRIIDDIHKLQQELQVHKYRYHVLDEPTISDYEYDMLYQKLRKLESEYPEAITPDSPTQQAGSKTLDRFAKIVHPSPILSLANAFNINDLRDWYDRIARIDSRVKNSGFVMEPKIDGLTVVIRYESGLLRQAATRGDGIQGEDVTENVKTIKSVPLRIPIIPSDVVIPQTLVVRGEIYIKKDDFLRLNNKLLENGEKTYQNPRNTASGSLRQLDSKLTAARPLSLLSYAIVETSGEMPSTQWELLNYLRKLGFPVSELAEKQNTIEEVLGQIESWNKKRDSIPYEVDGVVIKLNDLDIASRLGFVGKDPRGAIALKFPAREVSTILHEIRVNVGRTGVLTPYAILEPVEIGGVVVRQATLHNFDYIAEKDIRPGDRVLIKRAGDVIPYVIGPLIQQGNYRKNPYRPPENCPSCGQRVEHLQGEVAWYCVNSACPAQLVRNIEHFVSRGAMDIVGLGEKIVELLVQEGKIHDVADLYILGKKDLLGLEGFADKKAENILQSIQQSRSQSLDRLITGLGIHGIGEVSAAALARELKSIDTLRYSSREKLMTIEGVGPNTAQSILDWFSKEPNIKVVEKLKQNGIWPVYSVLTNQKTTLVGKIFVITGTLPMLSRDQAKELIENNGGKVTDSVSSNTNYLVVGENAGSKLDKAKNLGVKTINEEELRKLIGETIG